MTKYTVTATLDVEISNPTALEALAGGGGGDERSQIQAAVDAGLRELPGVAQRYGFRISDARATVEPA